LQASQLSNIGLPAHLSTTLWLQPDHVPGIDLQWVNKTFWDMRSRGWWFSEQGIDAAAIMGDTCPTIFPFFPSEAEDAASFWTVSRWAARFVDEFPNITHSDRLACWIVIFVNFQVRCNFKIGTLHIMLIACSGRYVPMQTPTVRCQIGIVLFLSRNSYRIWHV
jgi:hypothetical protein